MAAGRYSALIKLATKFSLGYGAFLGIAANAQQPQNMRDAQDQARYSTLVKNMGRDIGIGLADDFIGLGIGAIAATRIPAFRGAIAPAMGFIAAAGAGVATATGFHDIMNFFAARHYVANNRSKNDGKIGDYRLNPLDGFVSGGAGGSIRSNMTGINSPASQAVFNQITRNPYANVLSMLIPKNQRAGTDPGTGEAPMYNPVRMGLLASHGVGLGAELLTAGRYGFGAASLTGSLVGAAAGVATIQGIQNPSGSTKGQAYRALLGSYVPLFSTFATIEGLRALRTSRLAPLALIGRAFEGGVQKAVQTSYEIGREGGLGYRGLTAAQGYLDKLPGRYESFVKDSGLLKRTTQSLAGAAMNMRTNIEHYPGVMHGMINKFYNAMYETGPGGIGVSGRAVRGIFGVGGSVIKGADRFVAGPAFFVGRQVLETFAHTGAPHGAQWAQSFALAHLITDLPHNYELAHSVISGQNHTLLRKRHRTTSMPSNSY